MSGEQKLHISRQCGTGNNRHERDDERERKRRTVTEVQPASRVRTNSPGHYTSTQPESGKAGGGGRGGEKERSARKARSTLPSFEGRRQSCRETGQSEGARRAVDAVSHAWQCVVERGQPKREPMMTIIAAPVTKRSVSIIGIQCSHQRFTSRVRCSITITRRAIKRP
eukprot:4589242-Pleurochrysis_carterae.AAC.2